MLLNKATKNYRTKSSFNENKSSINYHSADSATSSLLNLLKAPNFAVDLFTQIRAY